MAPEIDLSQQRPAEFVFSRNVAQHMDTIRANNKSTSVDTEDHQDLLRTPDPLTGKASVPAANVSSAA